MNKVEVNVNDGGRAFVVQDDVGVPEFVEEGFRSCHSFLFVHRRHRKTEGYEVTMKNRVFANQARKLCFLGCFESEGLMLSRKKLGFLVVKCLS